MSEQQHGGHSLEPTPHRPTRGDPPREYRFKSGESGNPRGRPKGSKNFATLIRRELDSKVTGTSDGRTVTMTKREAMAKRMVNEAVKGDLKFIEAALRYSGERDSVPEVLPPMDAEHSRDREILAAFTQRMAEGGGYAGTA
ncbi:DUF5681 domain-containing protein [Sphingomonas citri]